MNNNRGENGAEKNIYKLMLVVLLFSFLIVMWASVSMEAYPDINVLTEMEYTEFEEKLEGKDVYRIEYSNSCEYMKVILYNEETKGKTAEELQEYTFTSEDYRKVQYPAYENFRLDMLRYDVELVIKNTDSAGAQIGEMVSGLILPAAFLLFWGVMLYRMIKSIPKTFENSTIETKQKTDKKLKDVIGHEEIMDDLQFILKMLKQEDIGKKLGAKVPKGILFSGEPGTGKTLIAKALAGEADVPFLYMNASNFVELYVGMGAKRVRELFKEAKKSAPCIVFIDEIDAVGASRFGGQDSNSERQQTVNALLQEMDGFKETKGVLVIAATNNEEILDKALTRAGRFDRTIVIAPPRDYKVRKELFEHFTEGMLLNEDVDLEKLSRITGGFTGADIQTVCNEAAMIAVSREQDNIVMDNFEEAIDKKALKGNRSTREQKAAERELVTYHESGHAVLAYLTKKPIAKVTITGTTSGVGGYVMHEDSDKAFTTKADFERDIMVSFAGRASEEIRYGKDNISIGASSDITQATQLIRTYVTRFGFDEEMGMLDLNVIKFDEEKVHARMREISVRLYKETLELLKKNYGYVEKLVGALGEKDTLLGNEVMELFESVPTGT